VSDNKQNLSGETAGKKRALILSSPRRRLILLVGGAAFFYWAAIYLYAPILPVYAQRMGASLSMVGIIVGAYALPQVLLRIPLGFWSDILGKRKPIVIGGVLMILIGSLGLVLAPSTWFIALSRFVVGIGAAIWVDFSVYFISFYPENKTSWAVGVLNFLTNAALLVATLGGGIITDAWGARYAFFGAIALGLVSLVALLFSPEAKVEKPQSIHWGSLKQVATRPLLIVVSIMGILVFFAQFTGVWGFISVYGAKLGATNTQLSLLSMLSIASSMVLSLSTFTIVKRLGYSYTIILASIVMSVTLIIVPFVHNLYMLDVVQLINGAGKGVLTTVLMSLCIYSIAPQQRATAMGLYQATYAIGMLVGPIISGVIADSYGLTTIFYLSGCLILIVAAMAFLRVLPRLNTEKAKL
jgi:predicted MFS family arabinose efflux permease